MLHFLSTYCTFFGNKFIVVLYSIFESLGTGILYIIPYCGEYFSFTVHFHIRMQLYWFIPFMGGEFHFQFYRRILRFLKGICLNSSMEQIIFNNGINITKSSVEVIHLVKVSLSNYQLRIRLKISSIYIQQPFSTVVFQYGPNSLYSPQYRL